MAVWPNRFDSFIHFQFPTANVKLTAYPQDTLKNYLRVTDSVCYTSLRSMKTCLNISATNRPTMTVAKATRHSRYNQGYVFSLGLSSAIGQGTEGNLDRLAVSR
jgi:hypothetical protein